MHRTTGLAKIDSLNVREVTHDGDRVLYVCRIKVDLGIDSLTHVGFTPEEALAAEGLLAASLKESDGGDASKAASYKFTLKREHPPAHYRLNGDEASFLGTPHGAPTFKAVQGVASLVFTVQASLDAQTLVAVAGMVRDFPVELLAGSIQGDLLEALAASA